MVTFAHHPPGSIIFGFALGTGQEIVVDRTPGDHLIDRLPHRFVENKDYERDRRQDKGVLGHRLSATGHAPIFFPSEVKLRYPLHHRAFLLRVRER